MSKKQTIQSFFSSIKTHHIHQPLQTPIRHQLNETSWLDISTIPTDILENIPFNEVWDLHPIEHGNVVIYGNVVEVPRWQHSYMKPYFFSGISHDSDPLPPIFQPLFDWTNSLNYGEYNQCLINWYENGHHYISAHSDDESEFVEHSSIMSITLGETRTFRIREKTTKNIVHDIELPNGTYCVMGGNMQRFFTHEIVKVAGKKGERLGPRINITFRQFI